MKNKVQQIAVLGSGAWGSALANVLADNGHEVTIYGINEKEIEDINLHHQNQKFFSAKLHENIKATKNLKEAINKANYIIIAVPSFAIDEIIEKLKSERLDNPIIINVTKGLDKRTNTTIMQHLKIKIKELNIKGVVSLLGPSFAKEVAERKHTVITSVSENDIISKKVQHLFSNKYFRVYTNNDEIGSEYCAALKNVIALASGMLEGYGLGNNIHAALIARGLKEITRFVSLMGGKEETCLGLTGLGDLVLTCSSTLSRNYEAGIKIAQLGSYQKFKEINSKTVEGIYACSIAYNIAKSNNIYAPIVSSIYHIINNNADPKKELDKLMTGKLKKE